MTKKLLRVLSVVWLASVVMGGVGFAQSKARAREPESSVFRSRAYQVLSMRLPTLPASMSDTPR